MRALLKIIPGTPALPGKVCDFPSSRSHLVGTHSLCQELHMLFLTESLHRWTSEVGALTIHPRLQVR